MGDVFIQRPDQEAESELHRPEYIGVEYREEQKHQRDRRRDEKVGVILPGRSAEEIEPHLHHAAFAVVRPCSNIRASCSRRIATPRTLGVVQSRFILRSSPGMPANFFAAISALMLRISIYRGPAFENDAPRL